MKLYGFYLSFDDDIPQNIKDATNCQLNNYISTLNAKYKEDCKIRMNVEDYDYFIATTNLPLIEELILKCDIYLKENSIQFFAAIALLDILQLTQTSNNSDMQDTLDLLKKYIIISPDLLASNYYIGNIDYFQVADNGTIYKVNLRIKSTKQLEIKIACLMDETDSINIPEIVSLLDNSYDDILNKIPNLTKEKNV